MLTLSRESFSMRAELHAYHSPSGPILAHVTLLRYRNQQTTVSQTTDNRLVVSTKSASFQAEFPQPPLRARALGRLASC